MTDTAFLVGLQDAQAESVHPITGRAGAMAPSVHCLDPDDSPVAPRPTPNTACAHGTGHGPATATATTTAPPPALPLPSATNSPRPCLPSSAMPPSRVSLRHPARDGNGARPRRVHRHRSPPPPLARLLVMRESGSIDDSSTRCRAVRAACTFCRFKSKSKRKKRTKKREKDAKPRKSTRHPGSVVSRCRCRCRPTCHADVHAGAGAASESKGSTISRAPCFDASAAPSLTLCVPVVVTEAVRWPLRSFRSDAACARSWPLGACGVSRVSLWSRQVNLKLKFETTLRALQL